MRHKNSPLTIRAQSPAVRRNRRALTVKMNNFFEGDTKFADTGTWPVKKDKKRIKIRKIRPLTATLDKPRLLDIALMGKIDMSRMTKELLSIYRIMRKPAKRIPDTSDEENQTPETKSKKDVETEKSKITVKLAPPIVWQRRGLEKFRRAKLDEVFIGPLDKPLIKPCDSCGRESRPERLHAHPPTVIPPTNKKNDKQETSAKNVRQNCVLKVTESPQKSAPSPDKLSSKKKVSDAAVKKLDICKVEKQEAVMGVPLMCSYCGKRFGSASLAIHEAKCKDKTDSDGGCNTSPTRRSSSPRRQIDHQKARTEEEVKRPTQLNQLTVPVLHSPRPVISPRGVSSNVRRSKGGVAVLPTSSPARSPKRTSEYEDYVFKPSGELDCEATFHTMWASHLRSLVTCQVCGRSFAPERIEKHQGVCNGSSRRVSIQKNR